jgi:hypothetical protein
MLVADSISAGREGTQDELKGCQIFLGTTYQNGEKYTNYHKIYQITTKYTTFP